MKFVSWNVNGFRSVLEKGFEDFSLRQTQTFLRFRKPSSNRNRQNSHLTDISDTFQARRRKDIPEPRFIRKSSRQM